MTTIYCTQQLRDLWPVPLALQWRQQYPDLFDDDDLRLTKLQNRNHFCEWFAAIHLFQSRGVLSLIEKYRRKEAHPHKWERFVRLLSPEQRDLLNNICKSCAVQPPDLLLYAPDLRDFWFAEIKGPRDDLSEKQRRSHTAITEQLKVSVEMIEVRIHKRSARRRP